MKLYSKIYFHIQKEVIGGNTNINNSSEDQECYCLMCADNFKKASNIKLTAVQALNRGCSKHSILYLGQL